jgi:nucleoside-diphosphate-sugar epimerase
MRKIMVQTFKNENEINSMSKTIIVTGGAGFIGSHLCEWLLEGGNKVICVDNLVTGKKENIKLLLKDPGFTFIEHDVSKVFRVDGHVDEIYHMSSPASPIDYQKLPIETMMVNSLGTKNMLDMANEKRAKILLASTSEVYGDPEEHPQTEDYWGHVNPTGPRSCYDESKRFAEALAMAYNKVYYVDVKIARIFNTYGPRMRSNDGRVIPNFVMQALRGEDITVYGDGHQTRSFCYVSDMIDGLMRLMASGKSGEIMNLGNPDERSVMDVAKMVKEMTDSASKITFLPLPKDDPTRRKPDISRAKEKLGWKPKVSFESGLKKTVEWFKSRV